MLLAAMAFVHQTGLSIVSQAAAAVGLMPEPAVAISEAAHYHGNLARHVHTHHGDQLGHVHGPSVPDPDDTDLQASALLCIAGVSPALAASDAPAMTAPKSIGRVSLPAHRILSGIDPSRLNRPPSTPSIA